MLTVFVEPEPLPSIITVVPLGEGIGEDEGVVVGEGLGVEEDEGWGV